MVDVAQLVRAPVCGTGGRGFKSRHPPHLFSRRTLGGNFNCILAHLSLAVVGDFLFRPEKWAGDTGWRGYRKAIKKAQKV